ncbi:probable E3 ubiquitin-protein ligase MARCH10 isoform X3 [Tupaia chinensis]|nr:probable E3 ubiquitin-protein ligase MARCH10 isoform X3 [Tupaia chinensis]XP_006146883.1 probable E3 ubiquitin-protein ligase MARCH10 isoform X3 [Tupaia chinensis]XP_006146884.1 probable E3 ubiquitin-protein ligase MARCH10 isoform X3 [Tupaia chinensis]
MLHEAKDRQKFVSDVQYLRDMQHKVDSEYQACLRRQEPRRDSNEKKRDQLQGQETNIERSRFSSGSSSRQSSGEEDPLSEPRASTKTCTVKCDSRLPAIDQTVVKQKHKSTMTPRKPEKVGPSKPSPAAPLIKPKILSRKRRPNLGRLTVSPELHSPGASGDRSRQAPQLLGKAPALRRADPVVQQDSPVWAGDTKLKRPTQERRNLAPSSQLMTTAENPSERAKKGDLSALSQNESHPALSQAFQGANSPQVLSESLGSPLSSATMGGPRRVPFRFRDEDFYATLSLNTERESDETEEETQAEEELLLVGMYPPRSPSSHKRSRFLRTSTLQAKNKNFEENAENCKGNSFRRGGPSHGLLRISNALEPVTGQPSVGQRMSQDPGLPDGESAKENDSCGSEKTCHPWNTKLKPRQDDGLDAENASSESISMRGEPGTHDYEKDWQDYLNGSRNSLDCFLSDRPAAPRSSTNSSYNTPESLVHSALRNDTSVDSSMSSTLVYSSDSEGNPRFNIRRPLSPIRSRNPFASAENHSYFPVNSALEFDVRETEDTTLTSQPQGAPLCTEDFLLTAQSSLSLVDSSSSSPARTNLQGHLHVPRSLQENLPFTFFAVSDFPNQNDNRTSASDLTDEKEVTKIKADPEKLKKLQESLLEEDSEEEGDLCRICQLAGGSPANPLLEPCACVGSLQFVHQECLKKWLKVKITSGADLSAVMTCEMCKQGLLVDPDDFNMTEFYQKHQQSRAQNELMNSGLYLVLLLHLYEQRFAELMRLNYSQTRGERLSRNYPQPRPEENESRFEVASQLAQTRPREGNNTTCRYPSRFRGGRWKWKQHLSKPGRLVREKSPEPSRDLSTQPPSVSPCAPFLLLILTPKPVCSDISPRTTLVLGSGLSSAAAATSLIPDQPGAADRPSSAPQPRSPRELSSPVGPAAWVPTAEGTHPGFLPP